MPQDISRSKVAVSPRKRAQAFWGETPFKPADAFLNYPPMPNETAAKQVGKRTIGVKLRLRGGRAAALIGSTARAPTIAVIPELFVSILRDGAADFLRAI
jgi:hypothetical protein